MWRWFAINLVARVMAEDYFLVNTMSWKWEDKRINHNPTGCRVKKELRQMTCKDPKKMVGRKKFVPDRAFQAVVDCTSMDSIWSSLLLEPGSECAKMVFTQHGQKGVEKATNGHQVEVYRGQVVNITCVLVPVPHQWTHDDHADFSIGLKVTPRSKDYTDMTFHWQIGNVEIRPQNKDDEQGSRACYKVAREAYDWKLSVTKSVHNVHELLWSSQPEEPSNRLPPYYGNVLFPWSKTSCLKDVAFKELGPKIWFVGSLLPDRIPAKLEMSDAPRGLEVPWKHEEKIKLVVDPTALSNRPKTATVEIHFEYGPRTLPELPVENPNIPDSPAEPNKNSFNWAPLIWVLVFLLIAAGGFGAFLYRRNALIQSHAREVLP